MTRAPVTGRTLEEPVPPVLRLFAVFDADEPCTDHQVSYTGTVPVTGALRCHICGTTWDPQTGDIIKRGDADVQL